MIGSAGCELQPKWTTASVMVIGSSTTKRRDRTNEHLLAILQGIPLGQEPQLYASTGAAVRALPGADHSSRRRSDGVSTVMTNQRSPVSLRGYPHLLTHCAPPRAYPLCIATMCNATSLDRAKGQTSAVMVYLTRSLSPEQLPRHPAQRPRIQPRHDLVRDVLTYVHGKPTNPLTWHHRNPPATPVRTNTPHSRRQPILHPANC